MFGLKVNLPKLDVNIPSNVGINVKGPSIGGKAGLNIQGPSLGGNAGLHVHGQGGPNINIHGPAIGVHGPSIGRVDVNVRGPEINPPNVNLNLSGPSIGPIGGPMGHSMGPPMGPGSNMYAIPEFAHDHPLICLEHLNGICKLCKVNLGGLAGYRCDGCDIILCFNCALRIFFGIKKVNAHPQHPLTLTNREKGWKCDICNNRFKGGASFRCNLCDFDACDLCYLGEGYPEGFIIPQVEVMLHPVIHGPPGPSQPILPPPGGYPPQSGPGFQPPPQQDVSFSSQSTNIGITPDPNTIQRLNETIKTYEFKIKNLETENINLRTSNMDERSKLQATIDSLQQQLTVKEGLIKDLEADKNKFFNTMKQYEVDLNRMRDDLARITNEKEAIIRGKIEENKGLGIQIMDLNKRISFLEGQLKIKENELGSINGRMMEEKKQLHIQIDNLNVQLMAAQNQLKQFDHIMITIKNYEEFLNKLKIDITQFQQSHPAVTIKSVSFTSTHTA